MLERTTLGNPLIPHTPFPRQLAFLELENKDALYGGAAAGGKSEALLMAALQFAEVPGYSALIVRRNFAELKMPGALIDRSKEWLTGKAKWNSQEHRWRFPRGSSLQFGYCEDPGDELRYQSSEFQFIGVDEAVFLTEQQLRFFFSRLRRRLSIPVPLRYRLASNPGGVSHDYVKKRYIKPGWVGSLFLPAKIRDNPAVDIDEYIANLKNLDPLTRARLLAGDWDAVPGGRFDPRWWRYFSRDGVFAEAGGERFLWASAPCFITVDPAASKSNAADHFVASTWRISPLGKILWWGCHRAKYEIEEQVAVCKRLYQHYGPQFLAVETVLNQRALFQILRNSTSPTMIVVAVEPLGRNKLERAVGAINLAASGRVYLPADDPAFPLEEVIAESSLFTGLDDREASDIVDTFSYAAQLIHQVAPEDSIGTAPTPIPAPAPGSWTQPGPPAAAGSRQYRGEGFGFS